MTMCALLNDELSVVLWSSGNIWALKEILENVIKVREMFLISEQRILTAKEFNSKITRRRFSLEYQKLFSQVSELKVFKS